jgi:hypothetical protein
MLGFGGNACWKSTWDFAGSAQNSLTQDLILQENMERLPKIPKRYIDLLPKMVLVF